MSAATVYAGLQSDIRSAWARDFADRVFNFGPLGFASGDEMLGRIRAAEGVALDQLFLSLLEQAQTGHEGAERVLLQTMLPKAIQNGRTSTALRAYSPTDAVSIAISTMWESIRTFPVDGYDIAAHSASVAGILGLNALRTIGRSSCENSEYSASVKADPTELDDLDALLNAGQPLESAEPTWGDSAFNDLVHVLSWAVDAQVLTRTEVSLLARFDLGDWEYGRASIEEAADELGMTAGAFQRRVHRIRCKLRAAVESHIAEFGRF